jgi:Flp pilus assembly protein TadG
MRRPDLVALSSLRRLFRAETGMAAVEFALILPILLTIWIGGVEVTQGLSVDRRLNNLAAAIGDLVSRSKALVYADVDAIFNIAPGALYPVCRPGHTTADCLTRGLSMRVTAVNIDATKKALVVWSRAKGTASARPVNENLTSLIDVNLRIPATQIIMAEVFYTYTPAVGYVITGTVPLDDRVYFTPRRVQYLPLCDNAGANCKGPPAA